MGDRQNTHRKGQTGIKPGVPVATTSDKKSQTFRRTNTKNRRQLKLMLIYEKKVRDCWRHQRRTQVSWDDLSVLTCLDSERQTGTSLPSKQTSYYFTPLKANWKKHTHARMHTHTHTHEHTHTLLQHCSFKTTGVSCSRLWEEKLRG